MKIIVVYLRSPRRNTKNQKSLRRFRSTSHRIRAFSLVRGEYSTALWEKRAGRGEEEEEEKRRRRGVAENKQNLTHGVRKNEQKHALCRATPEAPKSSSFCARMPRRGSRVAEQPRKPPKTSESTQKMNKNMLSAEQPRKLPKAAVFVQ